MLCPDLAGMGQGMRISIGFVVVMVSSRCRPRGFLALWELGLGVTDMTAFDG